MKIKGKVKWFNDAKGYGFINAENDNEDIFCHYSQIITDGFKTLSEDQEVYFDIDLDKKGYRIAKNIEKGKVNYENETI